MRCILEERRGVGVRDTDGRVRRHRDIQKDWETRRRDVETDMQQKHRVVCAQLADVVGEGNHLSRQVHGDRDALFRGEDVEAILFEREARTRCVACVSCGPRAITRVYMYVYMLPVHSMRIFMRGMEPCAACMLAGSWNPSMLVIHILVCMREYAAVCMREYAAVRRMPLQHAHA